MTSWTLHVCADFKSLLSLSLNTDSSAESNISENFPQQPENRRGRVTCLSKMSVLQLCFNHLQHFYVTLRAPMLLSGAVGPCLQKSIPNSKLLPIAGRLSLQSERSMSLVSLCLSGNEQGGVMKQPVLVSAFSFPKWFVQKIADFSSLAPFYLTKEIPIP